MASLLLDVGLVRSRISHSWSWRQGISCTRGSWSQGFWESRACVTRRMDWMDDPSGPTTEGMVVWPFMELAIPEYGSLPDEGQRP